jgi:hypothetical protein
MHGTRDVGNVVKLQSTPSTLLKNSAFCFWIFGSWLGAKLSVRLFLHTVTFSAGNMASFIDTFSSSQLQSMAAFLEEHAPFLMDPQPAAKSRKKVTLIAEPQTVIGVESLADMSREDSSKSWWQREDYELTKKNAKSQCRQLRHVSFVQVCLNDAYDACEAAASSNHEIDTINFPSMLAQQETVSLISGDDPSLNTTSSLLLTDNNTFLVSCPMVCTRRKSPRS